MLHKTTYGAALVVAVLCGMAVTVPDGAAKEGDATEGATTEPALVGDAASIARARAHYERVLQELRSADVSTLTDAQRASRLEAIHRLQRYCDGERYPVNTDDPARNLPYYLDDGGRRCAVSTLLYEMGGEEIVDRMAASDNHAFISTLSDDEAFQAWLQRTGLTLEETVRIMAPATQGEDVGSTANPEASTPTTTTNPTPAPNPVPGDVPGPITPGGGGPPGPTTPGGGGGGPTTGGPGIGGGGPTVGGGDGGLGPATGTGLRGRGGIGRETRSSLGADAWALWFEFSKTEFYQPNRQELDGEPAGLTGKASRREIQEALRTEMRREVLPTVTAALAAEEPVVRAAAAATLARIQGPDSMLALVKLLHDPAPTVRERAIMALGATGAPAARDILLRIAKTGEYEGKGITPAARALAHVALGVAANRGAPSSHEEILELFKTYRDEKQEPLETATLYYFQIAPHLSLAEQFHAMHPDKAGQPAPVRARIIEMLPDITTDKKAAFEALQIYLNGRSLEMRRSAAVAMGKLDHSLVLPQLMTAYELETEPVTRGLMLLSIARRGGETARGFLMHELRDGKDREMKPWAMLATGLLARKTRDAELRTLLHETKSRKNDRSAHFLALGLARDTASIPDLAEAAAKARQPWERARAAYALALMDDEAARLALRDTVWTETSTFVRCLQAFSLATIGHPDDTAFVVQAARETSDPNMIAPAAVGVRYLGSPTALELARRHASDPTVGAVGRATLIEALGMLLDTQRPLSTAALYRQSNFGNLPSWAASAFKSTF